MSAQRFQVFQAMWGMEGLPFRGGVEWSLEERVHKIATAGFDGAGVSYTDPVLAKRVTDLCREHGLRWSAVCLPATADDLKPIIETAVDIGIEGLDHLNLQPDVRPFTVLECIPLILAWQSLADEAGIALHFENHRGRMTTDIRFTLQLLDAIPHIKLTADLSHFVVGQEFRWPVSEDDHGLIRRVLERTWGYHGRVASREQVQLQISFPHNRQWLELFAGWWEEGFRLWRSHAPDRATLTFMPELGPPEWYAMTGPDGNELSDRWAEALLLKTIAEDLWRVLDEEDTQSVARVE